MTNPTPISTASSSDEAPITRDEMYELFGGEFPVEASRIIFCGDESRTIAQVRAEVRAFAKTYKKGSPSDDLEKRIYKIINEADARSIRENSYPALTSDLAKAIADDIRQPVAGDVVERIAKELYRLDHPLVGIRFDDAEDALRRFYRRRADGILKLIGGGK